MPVRRLTALAFLVMLLAAAPADAATTIGDTTTTPTASSSAGAIYLQPDDPDGSTYAVPAGGGVVTSLSIVANVAMGAVGAGRILVYRGAAPTVTIVGGAAVSVTGTGLGQMISVPSRIPVKAGDRLGYYQPSSGAAVLNTFYAPTGPSVTVPAPAAPPADGSSVSIAGASSMNFALSVSGIVEPDGDGDGFGDETQDTCPGDAGLHEGTCTPDLRVTATASPATVAQGEVSTIVATVTNAGAASAPGATATVSVPAGLDVLAASTTGGECDGAACVLGDMPAKATRKLYLIVRGAQVGGQGVGISAASRVADATPADNATSLTVTVTAAATAAPAPAPSTPTALCTVPRLKGKTAAAARAALKQAGCAAGKASGPRSRKARVRTQAIPAKVKVVAGTKVAFRLAVKRKRAP